jgi:hypothetical protein
MQGAGRAAWPFHASERQRRNAPASIARTFELFMDSPLAYHPIFSRRLDVKQFQLVSCNSDHGFEERDRITTVLRTNAQARSQTGHSCPPPTRGNMKGLGG